MTTLVTATEDAYALGEAPLWDPLRSRLLWVDISRGAVLQGRLRSDDTIEVLETVHFDETIGAVAVSRAGGWIVAGRERILFRSPGGVVTAGPAVLSPDGRSRLNDGKTDPAGRYLVGTLRLAGPSQRESLVAIGADGSLRFIDDDLSMSNGLAWSVDGRRLYNVDTERRIVFARSYDVQSGETGAREIFLTLDRGYPDGMTVDADDHLWIAMWGLGEVHRYSPNGRLVNNIPVPASNTTSLAFAGAGLDVLVITTARQDLSREQLTAYPLSGHVFTTRPGVRGLPQPSWNGLPRPLDQ